MKNYKYRAYSPIGIITFLLAVILTMSLNSCTKSMPDTFKRVDVLQGGELILVQGFLPKPATDPWVYIVDVYVCGKAQTIRVEIPAGQVYGETKFQSNCKVDNFIVTYDDIKRD